MCRAYAGLCSLSSTKKGALETSGVVHTTGREQLQSRILKHLAGVPVRASGPTFQFQWKHPGLTKFRKAPCIRQSELAEDMSLECCLRCQALPALIGFWCSRKYHLFGPHPFCPCEKTEFLCQMAALLVALPARPSWQDKTMPGPGIATAQMTSV